MKLVSKVWNEVYRSKPQDWNNALLEECSGDELKALLLLMGVAHSGTKATKIARLLETAALRIELAAWGEHGSHAEAHKIADDVIARYNRIELRTMAKRAKVFCSLPKRGIVISLLQWRDRCRRKGQNFNKEIRRVAKVQRRLPGF